MNEITIASTDLVLAATIVCIAYLVFELHKLIATVKLQKKVNAESERELHELKDRCDRQQMGMARLDQELIDMRQTIMRHAMNLVPMQSAVPAQATMQTRGAPQAVEVANDSQISQPARASEKAAKPTIAKVVNPSPVQLARGGAKVQELIARCGLSRPEAELVLSVHGSAAA